MAKYIDAEKLKAEIERLKGIGGIVPLDNREQKTGYESALIDIELFLDTLSEEPDKSLEEEAEKRYEQIKSIANIKGIDGVALKRDAFIRLAQYFAEWGAEHLKK